MIYLRAQLTQKTPNKSLLAQLRAHLAAVGISPEETSPTDMESLDLLAQQALDGVDIPAQHPAFFYQLLVNPELRRAFLDALEALEQMNAGKSPLQPPPAPASLEFLTKVPPKPTIQWWRQQKWRVTWQQTAAQLQSIFFPPAALSAHRAVDPAGDAQYLLFRSQARVENQLLDVSLDAVYHPDENSLHLILSVGQSGVDAPLFVTLRWGDYEQTLPLSAQPLSFPPLPITDVLDVSGDHIIGPLHLQIDAAAPEA
ncbi:MAG: hypothetical protein KC418_01350 [Anaerolineales bacterium]|nr:hypothetical protein [Anaerolineales bacterium]MCB8952776.1 hypothetical protein [Ardenticatenales bacterium]